MKPTDLTKPKRSNRAVSPVIGVILMVAITVILAAVIGAFVLEIGDQQETAPSTSFDTDEATTFYTKKGDPSTSQNLTDVKISHAGGETLDIAQTEINVDGNDTVWGPTTRPPTHLSSNFIHVTPQPNQCEAAGTNEKVSFSSGESWIVALVEHPTGDGFDTNSYNGDNVANWLEPDCSQTPFQYAPKDKLIKIYSKPGSQTVADADGGDYLRSGDEVTVVWTASSGGKTQSLQRYTVQTTSPELS